MDDAEASAHAAELFGPWAMVDDRGLQCGDLRYIVAPSHGLGLPWQCGVGPTWEAAFACYQSRIVEHGLAPVAAALARFSYTAHDEHRLYPLLERVLGEAGLSFEREHRLDDKNRLDFWFPELRVAMEVKVRGAPHRVFAQVERYAESPAVGAVLLASTSAKLLRIPAMLCGKQVRAVRLAGPFG